MNVAYRLALFALCGLLIAAGPPKEHAYASVHRSDFDVMADGTLIEQFTLTNASGMQVGIITYGGIITSIKVRDRRGELADVVLGYDSMRDYAPNPAYFGAIIGRYANRIDKARFTLDGRTYVLAENDDGNTLHGGIKGFDKAVWRAEPFQRSGAVGVVLTHTSPDGDEGFPGTLTVSLTCTLTDSNEIQFDYSATTDRPTVVNLTHHDYFNLAGDGSGSALGHVLMINADYFTPVNATLIPLGTLVPVMGTPMDFRQPQPLGARINAADQQLQIGAGYDHNFVIKHARTGDLALAARVEEPRSGRVLEVRTTEPGMQLYTANALNTMGKLGHVYGPRDAFCLETQHFPDSPNKPQFPSTTLRPGQMFQSRTVYRFSTH